MANQVNIHKFRYDVFLDLEEAAKLRTYIKGRTVPASPRSGRKLRKKMKKMSPSDFFRDVGCKVLKSVRPDDDSILWMNQQAEKLRQRRAAQDKLVREGANRKPRSEWEKTGPKKGKEYPKFLAAMKKLGEERRTARAAKKDKGE